MTLEPGKLPQTLLAELLRALPRRDPRVLVGPAIGCDAAVIDFGDRLLIAKTDPVTFATEDIGWYAVNVNANDIACMGARPAWFLAAALLPPGAPDTLPRAIFDQLTTACDRLGVELVGGHTEVTLGLDRPIIAGAMIGEASRDEIVTGENVRTGDLVLLTKGIAIEGTALLARESADALRARGLASDTIERSRRMLYEPGISVVPDARAICASTKPRLMHDPTEGGIATALHELAQAAHTTIRVDVGAIRILDETRAVCDVLALDPLGLLASGALLAIVDPADCRSVTDALADVKIACAAIGTVEAGPARVIMDGETAATPLPAFGRDELARFYATQAKGTSGTKTAREGPR